MKIQEVDERLVESEVDDPRFLVYLFDAPLHTGGSFACTVHLVEGADVSEVLAWAEAQPASVRAVALLTRMDGRNVVHWIEGVDPNRSDGEPLITGGEYFTP